MKLSGVLVLDESMRPIEIISAERAVTLIYEGKAQSLLDSSKVFRSQKLSIAVPEVILLYVYVPLPKRATLHVSNAFLFPRDNYTCLYCGKHKFGTCGNPSSCNKCLPKSQKLTRDHVKPISRHGGDSYSERKRRANTWENCVTACFKCNGVKGNRLPYECGMYPNQNGQPYTPKRPNLILFKFVAKTTPAQWKFIEPWVAREK